MEENKEMIKNTEEAVKVQNAPGAQAGRGAETVKSAEDAETAVRKEDEENGKKQKTMKYLLFFHTACFLSMFYTMFNQAL